MGGSSPTPTPTPFGLGGNEYELKPENKPVEGGVSGNGGRPTSIELVAGEWVGNSNCTLLGRRAYSPISIWSSPTVGGAGSNRDAEAICPAITQAF
jgi:hypothetical protein